MLILNAFSNSTLIKHVEIQWTIDECSNDEWIVVCKWRRRLPYICRMNVVLLFLSISLACCHSIKMIWYFAMPFNLPDKRDANMMAKPFHEMGWRSRCSIDDNDKKMIRIFFPVRYEITLILWNETIYFCCAKESVLGLNTPDKNRYIHWKFCEREQKKGIAAHQIQMYTLEICFHRLFFFFFCWIKLENGNKCNLFIFPIQTKWITNKNRKEMRTMYRYICTYVCMNVRYTFKIDKTN